MLKFNLPKLSLMWYVTNSLMVKSSEMRPITSTYLSGVNVVSFDKKLLAISLIKLW